MTLSAEHPTGHLPTCPTDHSTDHPTECPTECQHDHDCGHDHDHDHGPLAELVTLRDWLRHAVTSFNRHGIFCGHGVDNSFDEAVWLILGSLSLPLDRLDVFLDACIPGEERAAIFELIERRSNERIPTAYLLGEAWLGGYRFQIDERVIVPRSYFAAALADELEGWLPPASSIGRALDLCTGSGCLAILMAEAFPAARIDAVDLSVDALDVALQNVTDYGLQDRVRLLESDLFTALGGERYDFILSNPPYVTTAAMDVLPAEYLHEPRMALAAGDDGLDLVRRILADAADHLNPHGLLAIEVGHNRALVDAAFPELPLHWLQAEDGVDAIFVLRREDLPASS